MFKHISPSKQGYSEALVYAHTDAVTIEVAGQVGADANGIIPVDVGEQAANALRNMSAQLQKAGASIGDIVKINVYIVNIDQAKVSKVGLAVFSHTSRSFFSQLSQSGSNGQLHNHFKSLPRERRAASTWVGVQGLVDPRWQVEIECKAVVKTQSKL